MNRMKQIVSGILAVMICMSCAVIPMQAAEVEQTENAVHYTASDLHELISYDDAVKVGHRNRLNEEEELNTLVFANSDGTKTMYYYAEDIKYETPDGTIHDKTNDLTYINGSYVSSCNDIVSSFPKDIYSGVSVSYEDIKIEMTPSSLLQIDSITDTAFEAEYLSMPKGVADTVTYTSVFGDNTLMRYSSTYSGMKGDIVLTSYSGLYTFDFIIQTEGLALIYGNPYSNELTESDDGRWYFALPEALDVPVAYISDIVMYDNVGKMAVGSIKCEKMSDSVYDITVIADKDFLEASDTVYPVTIDSTITIDKSDSSTYIADSTLYKRFASTNYGNSETLTLDSWNGAYSVLRMGTAARVKGSVISASLYLYCSSKTGTDKVIINPYKPKTSTSGGWNENYITYANEGVEYYSRCQNNVTVSAGRYNSFDITDAVMAKSYVII